MPRIQEDSHTLVYSKIDRTIMEKAVEWVNLPYFLSVQWGKRGASNCLDPVHRSATVIFSTTISNT